MELYHIHRKGKYENYHEGEVIYPGSEFNSMHENFLNTSSSYPAAIKNINDKQVNYLCSFDKYLDKKLKRDNITEEEFKKMMEFIKCYVWNSSIDFREMILEEVRREFYPNLPSRYKCIWLTDERGLDYWMKQINLKRGFEYLRWRQMEIYLYQQILYYQINM